MSYLFYILLFFVVSMGKYGFSIKGVLVFAILVLLLAIASVDKNTMTIPNNLVLALIILSLLSFISFPQYSCLSRIIGAFCVSLPMFLITLFIKGSFGGGDIKLIFAGGALLGWRGVLVAMCIALLSGGSYAFYLLVLKKADRKSQFAFGPFLALGIGGALLWGEDIINLYSKTLS